MDIRYAQGAELENIYRLAHDMYVLEQYIQPQPEGILRQYLELEALPTTSIIVGVEDNYVLGTVTVAEDGPNGLPADEDFRATVDEIRQECAQSNQKLGAAWRFLTDLTVHDNAKIALQIMVAAVEEFTKRKIDRTLYIFNPKHERVYERVFGLKRVATGVCKSVQGAPAILMESKNRELLPRWQIICKKYNIPNNLGG